MGAPVQRPHMHCGAGGKIFSTAEYKPVPTTRPHTFAFQQIVKMEELGVPLPISQVLGSEKYIQKPKENCRKVLNFFMRSHYSHPRPSCAWLHSQHKLTNIACCISSHPNPVCSLRSSLCTVLKVHTDIPLDWALQNECTLISASAATFLTVQWTLSKLQFITKM